MQLNLITLLVLGFTALNMAAPIATPDADADAGHCCASLNEALLTL